MAEVLKLNKQLKANYYVITALENSTVTICITRCSTVTVTTYKTKTMECK